MRQWHAGHSNAASGLETLSPLIAHQRVSQTTRIRVTGGDVGTIQLGCAEIQQR
jgi:hypothetical protein